MSLTDALRQLWRYRYALVCVPLLLAGAIFFFTRHEKKVYASEMTIYTGIASGYTLSGNAESDFFRTSNAFDNLLSLIKSRETREEVACRLLAHHLQLGDSLDAQLLSWPTLSHLHELLPARLRARLTGPTLPETLRRVRAYAAASDDNELYRLLNSHDDVYSVEALGRVTATRINSSDLIRLEYEAGDAAVCRHTLQLTTQVFSEQYRGLRVDQTQAVIHYYERETDKALRALSAAESRFLAFNKDNDIINYYEQTKYIAGEREYLNSDINKIEMQYAAARAALRAVDGKLAGRAAAILSSGELVSQRRRLEALQAELANQEVFARQREGGSSPALVPALRAEVAATTAAMHTTLTTHYAQVGTVEGMPSKSLLEQWLQNLIAATENEAKLAVMQKRKGEFMAEYHRMAPLGATLKIIEREIDLAQKTYLVLLNHLNDSKASQQNNELTTELKVVAPAFRPLHPRRGKRRLLLAGGAFGGFFFVATLVLGAGLLDGRLRKPSIAARHTGLPVLGVVPMPLAPAPAPATHEQASLHHVARQLLARRGHAAPGPPFVVALTSPRRHEGRTSLTQALAARCAALGLRTVAVYPTGTRLAPEAPNPEAAAAEFYDAARAAVQLPALAALSPTAARAELVLLELPALLEDDYPVSLLASAGLVLLVLRADRRWEPKDQQVLRGLRAATAVPVEVVLTGVDAFDGREILA